MIKIKNKKITVSLILGIISPPLLGVLVASAATAPSSTIDKIKTELAHMASAAFKESISIRGLMDADPQVPISKDDSCKVPIPNTIMKGTKESSPKITCYEFFMGKGSEWNSLMSAPSPKLENNDVQAAADYLTKYGYSRSSTDESGYDESLSPEKCMAIHVMNADSSDSDRGPHQTDTYNKICANVNTASGGRIASSFKDVNGNSSDNEYWINMDTSGGAFGTKTTYKFGLRRNSDSTINQIEVETDDNGIPNITWSEFIGKWQNAINGYTGRSKFTIKEPGSGESGGTSGPSTITYDTTYNKGTSALIVEAVLGYPYSLTISKAEVYNIYNKYLNSDDVELQCSSEYDYAGDTVYKWMKVQVKHGDSVDKNCWAREKHEVLYTGAKAAPGTGEYNFTREDMSLQAIIDQINDFDLENMIDEIDDIDNPTDPTSTDSDSKVEATCQNQGGAGSLGWIVCSILDWMKSATVKLYDEIVKPSLNVQPELFTEGGADSGAQKAWSIFRDFANIIFVILTLFVIFSQLTGVGIDNYGIKKILPKLVIAAVLINLSYIICLICVDLSNIVGNGVQELLNNINTTATTTVMDATDVNIGADVGIVAVGVTAAAIGARAIYSNPALLLTLFIAVLGVFIAILFIFILLAGRKAAIVLLTVVSPIAFILYMLPNTKKIYDKWFNLWKAMLLVYPICGLLIGGGNFASKLMLTIGNNSEAITAFTAMVVGIVPIFFVPTVIKSAYAALGSIGGTIAGFGGRMRGGATRRLNNSDINRRLQERGQEHRTRVRAGVDRHGNERNLNGFQRFIRGGRRSVARSRAQYVKDQETRSREDSMMGNGFTAALAGAESRVQDDAVKNEEAIIMNDSSLRDDNVALRNGLTTAILNRDSNKIRAYQNILSRKGEKGREHVREAMEDALRSGDVSDTAKRDYASNLINKWGADYKNNNRSTFDYANNVLDGAAATLGANGTKVSSLKQSTLASMDEAELIRTINGASGAELADLQNLAHDALQNETVRNNMKEGTRRELEVLASNSAKAAAAQQSEAQAQAAQQQRDQSMNDLNDQLQQIRAQSQSEIAQDMGQYESAIALAGQPTQKIRVQMRRDGKYINADSGQEIDIGRYRKI